MCRRAKESTRSFSRAGGVRCLLRDSAFCAGKSVAAIGIRNPTECVYPFKRNGRVTKRGETKTKERRFTNRLFFVQRFVNRRSLMHYSFAAGRKQSASPGQGY